MRAWKVILIGICLVVTSALAHMEAGNGPIHRKAIMALNSPTRLMGTELTSREASDLWVDIERQAMLFQAWQGFSWDKPSDSPSSVLRPLLMKRLKQIMESLLSQGRIQWLDQRQLSQHQLQSAFCQNLENCPDLRGFSTPLTKQIFILRQGDRRKAAQNLFHELLHVYQFTYRFPMDLIQILKLVEIGHLPSDRVSDFLNYFYESQATWYGFRLGPSEAWMKILISSSSSGSGEDPLFPQTQNKTNWLNKLPKIDQRYLQERPKQSSAFFGSYLVALYPEEIHLREERVIQSPSPIAKFHRHYGQAIESTYFGRLDFLFHDYIRDFYIFNPLHDAYYEHIATVAFEEEAGSACRVLIQEAMAFPSSPLAYWMELPVEQFAACPAYSMIAQEMRRLGLSRLDQGWNVKPPGALEVENQQPIHPQVRVSPAPKRPGFSTGPESLRQDVQGHRAPVTNRSPEALKNYMNSVLRPEEMPSASKTPFLMKKRMLIEEEETGGEGVTPEVDVVPMTSMLPQLEIKPIPLEKKDWQK